LHAKVNCTFTCLYTDTEHHLSPSPSVYGVMLREVRRQLNGIVRGRWLNKVTGTVFINLLGKPGGPC